MSSAILKRRPFGLMQRLPRATLNAASIGRGASLALVFGAVIGAAQVITPSPVQQVAPPAPPPMAIRAIAPAQAEAINASIPVANAPNPAADPFRFKGNSSARAQAETCLASAIYYEAGNQDANGGRAVAQVVLNRVRHPAFPASVCGVVFQGSTRATGCQFTFTCDGSLYRRPEAIGWKRAKALADEALAGAVYAPVGWATFYHANYVVPVWAASLTKNAIVGAHLFYHWNGDWGRGSAFVQNYSGREANAEWLRTAALQAEAATGGESNTTSLDRAIADIPGAEPIKLVPSMRGDKRVAVRFNLEARKAADEAVHRKYTESVAASDNLKWVLSTESTDSSEKPLGQSATTTNTANSPGTVQH